MAVYTKKGDKGKTDLYSLKGLKKDCQEIEAIGTIDELNSWIGLIISFSENQLIKDFLTEIQKELFTINAILAGAKLRFFKTRTLRLEKEIDRLEKELPALASFILPGGSKMASLIQIGRTVARRAERELIGLEKKQAIKPQIICFLNRLSDYLFILARRVNYDRGIEEKPWSSSRN